jgi:hypothetical protein
VPADAAVITYERPDLRRTVGVRGEER